MKSLKIEIYGEVNGKSFGDFISKINNQDFDVLDLRINSPGGSVIEGIAIYNTILGLKNNGIKCVATVEGMCASIATYIAMACDEVLAYENALWLIHEPSNQIAGTADDIEKTVALMREYEDVLANAYSSKTGMKLEAVKAMMKEDYPMPAVRAKSLGFVDTIISTKNIKAMAKINIKSELLQFLGLSSLGAEKLKNTTLTLEDGTMVYIETEDGEFVGKRIYVQDAEGGFTTPAPDGNHRLNDGRTITVAGGVVTAVNEDATAQSGEGEKMKELENKIQAMTQELEDMKKAKATSEANLSNAIGEIEKAQAIINKFEEKFKNFNPTGNPAPAPKNNGKTDPYGKVTPLPAQELDKLAFLANQIKSKI